MNVTYGRIRDIVKSVLSEQNVSYHKIYTNKRKTNTRTTIINNRTLKFYYTPAATDKTIKAINIKLKRYKLLAEIFVAHGLFPKKSIKIVKV